MTLGGGTLTGTLTATKLQINAGAVITFADTAAPLPDRLQVAPLGRSRSQQFSEKRYRQSFWH